MNEKRKALEKVGFGIACMFGIYWIYHIFLQGRLSLSQNLLSVLGVVCLYGPGLLLFLAFTHRLPTKKTDKSKISASAVLTCFLLQFTAVMALTVTANLLAAVTGVLPQNNIDALTPYMLFMLLIFNPIIEEFVFRKLFADKLLAHGELLFVLTSSFCFAIVHGVSLGIPQIVYTFILGMVWSYLYVRTGSLVLPVVMHSLSNLFGSVLIQSLQQISPVALGPYVILIMLSGIAGLICFFVGKKKIVLDNRNRLVDKTIVKDIFTNRGILFYLLLTVCMFVVKNFIV